MPWITTYILHLIRKRNKIYNKAKKTNNTYLWALFRQLRASTKKCTASYHSYINNMIGSLEVSTKPFWRYINSRKGHSQSVQSMQSNGIKVTAPRDIAEALNSQFHGVHDGEPRMLSIYKKCCAPFIPKRSPNQELLNCSKL